MPKFFTSAERLSEFMKREREVVVTRLCQELACTRESLAFIFEGSEIDAQALEIPRLFAD